jgi:hypothetical protein
MRIEVRSEIRNNHIILDTELTDVRTDYEMNLGRKIIETEDAMAREALIKLGWTPPEQEKSCLDCKYLQNVISDTEIACDYHCGFFDLRYKYCGCWEGRE